MHHSKYLQEKVEQVNYDKDFFSAKCLSISYATAKKSNTIFNLNTIDNGSNPANVNLVNASYLEC